MGIPYTGPQRDIGRGKKSHCSLVNLVTHKIGVFGTVGEVPLVCWFLEDGNIDEGCLNGVTKCLKHVQLRSALIRDYLERILWVTEVLPILMRPIATRVKRFAYMEDPYFTVPCVISAR